MAMQGAKVMVNDLKKGVSSGAGAVDVGTRAGEGPRRVSDGDSVVAEIKALGGIASANYDDVSDWEGAKHMIDQTVEEFGDIHAVICNAGILRDRTMLNMSEQEWDLIFQVHCKGTFAPAHHAGNYWRNKSKETGEPVDARLIFTSSQVGIFGNYGQSNYAAAKAANAMFAMTLSQELDRYGVTVNAVCPSGITRMTEDLRPDFGSEEAEKEKEMMETSHLTNTYVPGNPHNVAPLVSWLVSPDGKACSGRVFNTLAQQNGYSIAESFTNGPWVTKDGENWCVGTIVRPPVASLSLSSSPPPPPRFAPLPAALSLLFLFALSCERRLSIASDGVRVSGDRGAAGSMTRSAIWLRS
jgi:NAD(P)-dependent dehydrogenase (short-subunit alcohol dehydrogenase family)